MAGVGALSSLALGLGGWQYVTEIEPSWVDVAQVVLPLKRLTPAFDGLRLVQISDIHLGGGLNRSRLDQIVRQVTALEPDVIALTGDYLHGYEWKPEHARHLADLAESLRPLAQAALVVAVMGNHDHWVSISGVRDALEKAGVVELNNTVHTLQRGAEQLHLAGVDSVYVRRHRLPRVLEQLPADGAALLLAHEPDFADESAASGRFDLQISGHSHGGQVSIPLIGPPVLPRLGKKYPAGLYRVGEMYQYTNRGVGTGGINVRFNCRPEITIFTLKTADLSGNAFTSARSPSPAPSSSR